MENYREVDDIIDRALAEDMPAGDITSESVIPPDSVSVALILAKEPGVLAGIMIAERVFTKIDHGVRFNFNFHDGQPIMPGDRLARIQGSSLSLLKGERTALNFLQRMSGIATLTRKYVQLLEGTKTKLLDTRKTTPGLRTLEKYAVRMGGGYNHRMSLSDMVMLKDNHLKFVGSISAAVKEARDKVGPEIKIEVETTTLEEVKEAVESGADIVMLDNMSVENMRKAVEWVGGNVPLEISGKVDRSRIQELVSLGVDYISVGSLTHSYDSLDISMDFLDSEPKSQGLG